MKPEDGKGIYDSIEIPEELDQIVRQSIAEAEKRRREKEAEEKESDKDRGGNVPEKSQEKRSAQAIRFSQRMAARFTAAAAGAAVVFTIGLNTNQAFAGNDETDSGNRISGRSSDDPFVSPGRSGLQY